MSATHNLSIIAVEFFIKVGVSSNRVAPATRISAVCLPSVFSTLKATVGLVLHKSRKKSRRNLHKSRISIWKIIHKSRFLILSLLNKNNIVTIEADILSDIAWHIRCLQFINCGCDFFSFRKPKAARTCHNNN